MIGFLYLKTAHHLVLLNDLRQHADLGSLKRVRLKHLVPEATIMVIPLADVVAITPIRARA